MAIPPISPDLSTREISLTPIGQPSEETRLRTVHEIFDWLRSMASTSEERDALDAEEAAFLRAYGDEFFLPKEGLTVKSLVLWALYGSSPYRSLEDEPPSEGSQGAMKDILYRHITAMKSNTLDRILYLLRILNSDKVGLDGRYKPPVEPEIRDVKTYHADYNDRTAYRIEHDRS